MSLWVVWLLGFFGLLYAIYACVSHWQSRRMIAEYDRLVARIYSDAIRKHLKP